MQILLAPKIRHLCHWLNEFDYFITNLNSTVITDKDTGKYNVCLQYLLCSFLFWTFLFSLFFWYKTNSIYVYMFKKESSVISWLEYVENKFNKRHCSFCFSLYFFLFTLTFSFLIRWFVIGLLLILWYLLLILSCFIREWLTQFKSFLNHFFPDLILNVLYESAAIYDIDRWKKIG